MYKTFQRAIQEKGITPYRVSRDTGISQVTLSDWKHGRSTPKVDKLLIISDYLKIPLDELVKEGN